ncbi:hypothetical protein ABE096_18560 [Robertmurraya massiliosenegalensis]
MKRMAKKELSGEEEDKRDAQQYRTYCDISFAVNPSPLYTIVAKQI